MVSEKKKEEVKKLGDDLKRYPVIGLLDMFKMPSKQLQEIRDKLKGKAEIKMVRKSIMKRAMENVEKKGIKGLEMKIQNQPALLFSSADPFELARIIESSRSFAAAKEGDVAPKDIVVKAGKTNLKAGPVIGEFQRIKIPAGVEGENIIIKKDIVVVKAGGIIEKNVADVLMKLGIEPIEISLNLLAVWDQGIVYPKSILFIPLERYENDLKLAYINAFNLSLNIGFVTKDNIPLLLSRAHREAMGLAKGMGLVTKDTVAEMLTKAYSQMLSIKEKVPEMPEVGKEEAGEMETEKTEEGIKEKAETEEKAEKKTDGKKHEKPAKSEKHAHKKSRKKREG